ncbi:MAG: M56 family metallopeptidase [Fulvivirga sp.]|uniref:M56 family metallopeptidase n=1 Tax=Fulvivirga sp. TaxID=1931237 RepID=UPI0032EF428C
MNGLVEAIGYTLLHSLWQGFFLVLLLFGIKGIFRIQSSSVKYLLACISLTVFSVSAFVTFGYYLSIPEQSGSLNEMYFIFSNNLIETVSRISLLAWVHSHIQTMVLVWLSGVGIMLVRFSGSILYLKWLVKKSTPVTYQEWHHLTTNLSEKLGIIKTVQLKFSDRIDVPCVVGILKPIILFPVSYASNLSLSQLELIISHELVHIKRYDFLVNIFQHLVESVFFFNPFVWMISNIIRAERENAVDDEVVSVLENKNEYIKTLAAVEEVRLRPLLATQFATNNNLITRIKRLTDMKTQNKMEVKLIALLVMAAIIMSFSWYSKNDEPTDLHRKDVIKNEIINIQPKDVDVKIHSEPRFDDREDSERDDERIVLTKKDVRVNEKRLAKENRVVKKDSLEDDDDWRNDDWPRRNSIHFDKSDELARWSEEFMEEFSKKFEDFYAEHGEELNRMSEELSIKMNKFDDERFEDMIQAEVLRAKEMAQRVLVDEERIHAELERAKEVMEKQLRVEELRVREIEAMAHNIQKRVEEFENELVDEIRKDGYLKGSERLSDLEFERNGDVSVNGDKVSDSDAKKYRDIYEKHFDNEPDGVIYKR